MISSSRLIIHSKAPSLSIFLCLFSERQRKGFLNELTI
uniref:Uncharacterized protein n=1 Tax=Siphoviridae sp. ctRg81 TaxID=2826336 RepID=A0A8S5NGL4_9CAUD|nr:MAG TPA: hypothetical protein [Siphoviridae sp. ctRg81]